MSIIPPELPPEFVERLATYRNIYEEGVKSLLHMLTPEQLCALVEDRKWSTEDERMWAREEFNARRPVPKEHSPGIWLEARADVGENEGCSFVLNDLWEIIGYVQVYKDGSAGYWFAPKEQAKPAKNLDRALAEIEVTYKARLAEEAKEGKDHGSQPETD
jgi:hypothetical protein